MKAPRSIVAVVLAAAVVGAGCGSGGDGDSSGAAGEFDQRYADELDRLYAGRDEPPPADGPAAQEGADVWLISCGEAADGCAAVSAGMARAAEAIGWDLTVFDGRFNAESAYSTGIRQALAAGADGIVLNSIDCDNAKQALAEAADAGVPVVGLFGLDCADEPLFAAQVVPNATEATTEDFQRAIGRAQATWLVSNLGDEPTILDFVLTDVRSAGLREEGFREVADECTACEVVDVPFTLADVGGGGLAQKADDALLRHPDAGGATIAFSSNLAQALAPSIVRAGRSDVLAVGGEGNLPSINLIRDDGGQAAAIAYDVEWAAWAGIDTLNRAFAGEPAAPAGFGLVAIDAEHNLPDADTAYVSPVDYQAAYRATWEGSR